MPFIVYGAITISNGGMYLLGIGVLQDAEPVT
jgi:hypothetical protein